MGEIERSYSRTFGVPIILVSSDKAGCQEAKELLGNLLPELLPSCRESPCRPYDLIHP
ncbi:MAG: hypothetical protein KAX20_00650 [Candidatus Omnitrophica bacterium]|nr:hypothetical protein [Candidatus Omnitrophota bacterium]